MAYVGGEAGVLEAVIVARAIQDGVVQLTINYETSDHDDDLDYVLNKKREIGVNGVMSANIGFGGHDIVLLFKNYTE